jgi:hypothetical protein
MLRQPSYVFSATCVELALHAHRDSGSAWPPAVGARGEARTCRDSWRWPPPLHILWGVGTLPDLRDPQVVLCVRMAHTRTTPRRGGVITFDADLAFSAAKLGVRLAVTTSTPSDESAASVSAPHRGVVWYAVRSICLRGLSACHFWRGGKGASPRPASGFGRRFLVHPRARPWPTIGAPRRSRRLRRPRRLRLPQQPRVWWGAVAEPAGCSMRAQMAGGGAAAFGGAASMLFERGFDAVACRVIARSIGGGASDGAMLQVRAGCERVRCIRTPRVPEAAPVGPGLA